MEILFLGKLETLWESMMSRNEKVVASQVVENLKSWYSFGARGRGYKRKGFFFKVIRKK